MDIIIFALISGFLFYKLYSLLGTGGDNIFDSIKKSKIIDVTPDTVIDEKVAIKNNNIWDEKINVIREKDGKFSEQNFIKGASKAYEMVINSYSKSDYKTLEMLTSPQINVYLKEEISKNLQSNLKIEKILSALFEPIIKNIEINENVVNILVEFKGEQIITKINLLDNSRESKRAKLIDQWMFQRDLESSSPNWKLIEMK